ARNAQNVMLPVHIFCTWRVGQPGLMLNNRPAAKVRAHAGKCTHANSHWHLVYRVYRQNVYSLAKSDAVLKKCLAAILQYLAQSIRTRLPKWKSWQVFDPHPAETCGGAHNKNQYLPRKPNDYPSATHAHF